MFTYLSENISVPHCSRPLDIFEGITIFCMSESASQFAILVYPLNFPLKSFDRQIKPRLQQHLNSLMGRDRCIDDGSVPRTCELFFFRRCNYNEECNSYSEMRIINSVGFEISVFRPFPYFLLTFSLALSFESFLEVG